MRSFVYFQPTEIRFGPGRLDELGEVVARYGRRCLLVTMPMAEYMQPLIGRVQGTFWRLGASPRLISTAWYQTQPRTA